MTSHDFFKILVVIAVSSVKFIGGPPLAYAYRFNFAEVIIYPVAGGMGGVFLMSFFAPWIIMSWEWLRNRFRRRHNHRYARPTVDLKGNIKIHYTYISVHSRRKILFSPTSRRIVKTWRKYGLIGLAIVTPVLLSIPIGTFIAVRFANHRKKIFLYMFISIVFWALIIAGILFKVLPIPREIVE